MRAWALIVTATILCGCNVSNLGDRVVMDQLLVLKDGESNIFKLKSRPPTSAQPDRQQRWRLCRVDRRRMRSWIPRSSQ